MFHWICPECGREIAPNMKECPVCDASSAETVAPLEAAVAVEDSAPEDTAPEDTAPPEAHDQPGEPSGDTGLPFEG